MKQQYKEYLFQERQLMTRHPELAGMTSMPLDQTDLNLTVLSDFIEMCWEHDYGSEPRIRFSSGFLAWNMGKHATGLAVLGKDGMLLGTVLYFKRTYLKGGVKGCYVIKTGLSVHPDYRGKGIGQWLLLKLLQLLESKCIDFSVEWYDTRHDIPGSPSWMLAANKNQVDDSLPVRIMARILNYDTAIKYHAFGILDRLAMKLNMCIFPCHKVGSIPSGYILDEFNKKMIPAYLEFLKRFQTSRGELLTPAGDDLLRWEKGAGHYASARFYALRKKRDNGGNRIDGLYFGHKVFLDRKWSYFQADGILISPGLPIGVAKSFIRAVETRLSEDAPCAGVTIAETGGGNFLWRYGYLPVVSQLLSMDHYALSGIPIKNLKQRFVELR